MNWIHFRRLVLTAAIAAAVISATATTLSAQDGKGDAAGVEAAAKDPVGAAKKALGFNFLVEVVPDSTGNLSLETGLDMDYFKGFNSGLSFNKVQRSQSKQLAKGYRQVDVVKDQVYKLRAFGYRFRPVESKSFTWGIRPAANGQLLNQEREKNIVDRSTDSFAYEDGKLQSLQTLAELETWLIFGDTMRLGIQGVFSPLNSNNTSRKGYDSLRTKKSAGDGEGTVSSGDTGDYTSSNDTNSTYMDAQMKVLFYKVFFGSDLQLGFRFNQITYRDQIKEAYIYNGELGTYTSKTNYKKQDITGSIGTELGFLGLPGGFNPFFSLTFTHTEYGSVKDNILGFAITFQNAQKGN